MDWGAKKCSAEKLKAQEVEKVIYEAVVHVLENPDVYFGEVQRRWHVQEQTIISLKRDLADLDRQEQEEREAEVQAIRLDSRFGVS